MDHVQLDEGVFKQSQETGKAFLLALDPDRLLAPCYEAQGQVAKKPRYGGWESMEIAGHSLGHYLSATAIMYQSTKDQTIKERLDYTIEELSDIQALDDQGYVSGFNRACFDEVFTGDFSVEPFSLAGSWVPWYSIHKIFAGLIDCYHYAGCNKAKTIVLNLSDWAERHLKQLTDEQFQRMLICEFGGMNEVFADIYLLTGETRYLTLAKRFQHHVILDPLAEGIDDLAGKHANTQIPKVIGTAKLYQVTKEEKYKAIVEFFFNQVVTHRSYVIGGNSIGEHFGKSDTEPLGRLTTETCNTYNMLKLVEYMFQWNKSGRLNDFYERGLYNHILASQDPDSGGKTYFVATDPGHFKVYCDKEDAFWCCTGSGMENPARYTNHIYTATDQELYLNLFIASTITLEQHAIQFKQTTAFPYEETGALTVTAGNAVELSLFIRRPAWLANDMRLEINGEPVTTAAVDGYIKLTRTWYEGDTLTYQLPMGLNVYHHKEDKSLISYRYGPIVLAAKLGRENYPNTDVVGDHQVYNHYPAIEVGPLVSNLPSPALVEPVAIGELTFQTKPVAMPHGESFLLVPFYAIHHERYTIYFRHLSEQAYQNHSDQQAEHARELLRRTVDQIQPGEQQPETDHQVETERSRVGYLDVLDRHWRDAFDGGFIRYQLKTNDQPLSLRMTYFGGDGPVPVAGEIYPRLFDLLIDGVPIATEHLQSTHPGEKLEIDYPIPPSLTKNKAHITLTLASRQQTVAGGFYGIRLLTKV
ncbi:hypothetical protein DES38_101133 [Streptohalobacillus salinus]|uniref:DUF1680 family protein n=1 Tax=Streptohalobacillus salinus TaxID=621096 RepID=A0A2V3WVC5_9BACI|nr:glycoside hydrolase family 127 protein [Streptohalobacillus salinus]PXW93052.1 hypothetical protein DES38_101133 [Streptohalobacillus salinus]